MRLDLSQILVLVVDDNKFIRRIVLEILRNFNVGYIVEAESGADALEKLEFTRPDIIICDWVMRPVNGIEFLRKIRAGETPILRQTPVVMLTGQLDATHVLEARGLGVNGYVAKPVTVGGVMNRIVDIVRATAPQRLV